MTFVEKFETIRKVYSNVVIMRDSDCYDIDDNLVEVDMDLVEEKFLEVKTETEQNKQAQIDARQKAINKLMALGLTEEEALALGVKQ
jgi:hypothetical protein